MSVSNGAVIAVLVALIPVYWTYLSGDPFSAMYANFLLFTPFRESARSAWANIVHFDSAVSKGHTPIPEIQAEDYSFETLRYATENFKYPAVVRGLFKGTPAIEKWAEPGYLASKIGKYNVPVTRKAIYGTLQNDRYTGSFGDAYEEILADTNSTLYLFFPVQSRFNFNASSPEVAAQKELKESINQIMIDDLHIDQTLWKGFGTKQHKTYFGSQIIAGRGKNNTITTGTGWHCAMGNNWFVQVAGMKRWYFMEQKYSSFMWPLRGGAVNMMTGNTKMPKSMPHLPLRYVDLKSGDLLYNPDWMWHTIKNYDGLSIGVPIRELNVSLSFRNNFLFTSIVMWNKLTAAIGIDVDGFPPATDPASQVDRD